VENKDDVRHELLDLMIEEANANSRDNSISIGLVKVLERVKKRLTAVKKPPTEIEHRLDRIEQAVKTMSSWLVQAQTGFGVRDAEGIHRILEGDSEDSRRGRGSE
jgi:hypothetical protein